MATTIATDVQTLRALIRTLTQLTQRLHAQLDAYPHADLSTPNLSTSRISTGTTPEQVNAQLAEHRNTLPDDAEETPCYIIVKGLRTGVFLTIDEVNPLTIGVSRSCASRCDNLAQAIERYTAAWTRGDVEVLY